MKRKIKVRFCDFNTQLYIYGNWILKLLEEEYDVEISDRPDFVFYSGWGLEHLLYNDAIKIFYSHEGLVPDFNDCDYAISMNSIDFDGRNLRLKSMPHIDYMYIDSSVQNNAIRKSDSNIYINRRFCNFIYSANRLGDKGHEVRNDFCIRLSQYKNVDCPGIVLNNMSDEELPPRFSKNEFLGKLDYLKKYKFTIAFEGTNEYSYTTERLMQSLLSHSIPIYWGNPLVHKDYNSKAFINCNDFNNDMDAVLEEVIRLDNDDDAYMEMIMQKPMSDDYDFNFRRHLKEYIYGVIENGKRFNKNHNYWSTAGWIKSALESNIQLNSINDYVDLSESVVIYGTGDFGTRALTWLQAHNKKVIAVCDSNKTKHGTRFFDYSILSPNELREKYEDSEISVVIAIDNDMSVETIYGYFMDIEQWRFFAVKRKPMILG